MEIDHDDGSMVNLARNVTTLGPNADGENFYFFFIRNGTSKLDELKKKVGLINSIEQDQVIWNARKVFSGNFILYWARTPKGPHEHQKVIYHEDKFLLLFNKKTTIADTDSFLEEINQDYENKLDSLGITQLKLVSPVTIFKTAPGFFAAKLRTI